MKPHAFIISILIISFIIVSGSLIWGNMIDLYSINATTDNFNATYDVIDETYNISESMKEATLDGELEDGTESWESTVKGSYTAIRFLKNSFTLIGNMLNSIAETIGIPVFAINFAIIGFTVLIIFSIIYMVFRAG